MDYSRHDIYTCNHVVLVNFHCSSLRKTPGEVQIYQLFGGSLVSVKSIEKVTSTQEQVQKYCNWRKEALFRLLTRMYKIPSYMVLNRLCMTVRTRRNSDVKFV